MAVGRCVPRFVVNAVCFPSKTTTQERFAPACFLPRRLELSAGYDMLRRETAVVKYEAKPSRQAATHRIRYLTQTVRNVRDTYRPPSPLPALSFEHALPYSCASKPALLQTAFNFIGGGCAVSLPLLYGVVVFSAITLARYGPLKSAMTRLQR